MNDRLFVFNYEGETNQRLDKFLVNCLPSHSRSRLQNLIKEGNVLVDGVVAGKTGLTLARGATVEVNIPPSIKSTLTPEPIPLDIIFENKDVLVINKAAGMVVHPAAGHASGTLVHAALAHVPELEGIGGVQRPGIVHRLDKNTSGIIVLAKNDQAHNWLQEQFRERTVKKIYLTLVDGHAPTPEGRVEAAIGRDPKHRKRMAVVPPHKGREAISVYRTLEIFTNNTLLEVSPLTGRTHQIRLHMAFIGCPIVGDTVYGRHRSSIPMKRHFLHAASLTIVLPGDTSPQSFSAPLPKDLEQVLFGIKRILPSAGNQN